MEMLQNYNNQCKCTILRSLLLHNNNAQYQYKHKQQYKLINNKKHYTTHSNNFSQQHNCSTLSQCNHINHHTTIQHRYLSSKSQQIDTNNSEFDLNIPSTSVDPDNDISVPHTKSNISNKRPTPISQQIQQSQYDTNYTDILDINNPPVLSEEIIELIKTHKLTIDDIDLGKHSNELKPALKFFIDAIHDGSYVIEQAQLSNDIDDMKLINNDNNDNSNDITEQDINDESDVPIEAELGFGLDNVSPPLYRTGLPVDKLECQFCKREEEYKYYMRQARKRGDTYVPDYNAINALYYTNVELLYTFLNERGMMLPRHQTGNCAKHQRKLSQQIMRSRYIGLLSYITRWKVDENYVAAVYGSNVVDDGSDQANQELLQATQEQRQRKLAEDEALSKLVEQNRGGSNAANDDVDLLNTDSDGPVRNHNMTRRTRTT